MNWDRWVDYGYRPDGLNRWYVNDNADFAWVGANALNQYTNIGASVPEYDAHFNVASYNGATFTYDAENHLVDGSMQATYDGLGRCVRRTAGGVTRLFTYDDWKPVLEWDGSANWIATNIYGAGSDEILARCDSSGRVLIYKQDQHGNVVAVLNQGGGIVEKYRYDAFGKPTISDWNGNGRTSSAIGNRFMYTGREWIQELGIYDYRHRMYHPGLGRFLQTDPMGLQTEGAKLTAEQKALFSPGGVAPEAFGSSEMNLYRYCGDDPMDRSDPMGLWPTNIHNQIYDQALSDQLSDAERNTIKTQSAREDHDQSAEGSYKHAMRDGLHNQTVDQARAAYERYIANNLGNAIRQQQLGQRAKALRALARGMHAISDANSPAHRGFQPWNGLPSLSDPLHAQDRVNEIAIHRSLELEASREQRNEASAAVRSYYEQFEAATRH